MWYKMLLFVQSFPARFVMLSELLPKLPDVAQMNVPLLIRVRHAVLGRIR
jgi:hypothetical protein